MAIDVTAKVAIYSISPGFPDSENMVQPEEQTVRFTADYGDDRNKEWAKTTPSIDVGITVKSEVVKSAGWEKGKHYTLVFKSND